MLVSGMKIISKESADFGDIEELVGENPDVLEIEMVAGIDCDDEDMATQREEGDENPIATLDLVAQWNPNVCEGVLDWYFVRAADIDQEEPEICHGGALLAFKYETKTPDLDLLLDEAVRVLNEEVSWAEFEIGEEE